MDTFECIRKRRDIRNYLRKDAPDDSIMKVVEAGRLAPSAMNMQPWSFVVIKNKETLRELGNYCYSGRFIVDAAFAVAVVTDPSTKWHEIDGARAVQNMALAAWNEGIGSCWIAGIDRDRIKDILQVPRQLHLLTIISFGYPEEFTVKRKKIRKSPEEVFHWEKFGNR